MFTLIVMIIILFLVFNFIRVLDDAGCLGFAIIVFIIVVATLVNRHNNKAEERREIWLASPMDGDTLITNGEYLACREEEKRTQQYLYCDP